RPLSMPGLSSTGFFSPFFSPSSAPPDPATPPDPAAPDSAAPPASAAPPDPAPPPGPRPAGLGRAAGLCRTAGPVLSGAAGLIGGGVGIRTAGVGTGVSVGGGLAGAARRIAAFGASAYWRVAGIGGGHRAAGTCQQR